jgi:hypothetical protein
MINILQVLSSMCCSVCDMGQRVESYCKYCHHSAAVCVCEYKEVVSFALNVLQDKNIVSIVIIVLQYVWYGAERITILQVLSSMCFSMCVMKQRVESYCKYYHHRAAVCVCYGAERIKILRVFS